MAAYPERVAEDDRSAWATRLCSCSGRGMLRMPTKKQQKKKSTAFFRLQKKRKKEKKNEFE
jgi:hypothetical protein